MKIAEGGVETAKEDKILKIEETLPVMKRAAEDLHWQDGWVYDGRHTMYAPFEIVPRQETKHIVELGHVRTTKYEVRGRSDEHI